MAGFASTIDKLPEVERKKVLDALLAGESHTSIAAKLGISRQSVSYFKKRIVKPALHTAAKLQHLDRVTGDNSALIVDQANLARSIVSTSPLRQRLDALGSRIDSQLTRAEMAVQVVVDGDGEFVPVANDMSILAPLYNQAHKNLELLGKVTGELQDKTAAPSVAIQIVVPAGTGFSQMANPLDPDGDAIDVGGVSIGLKR